VSGYFTTPDNTVFADVRCRASQAGRSFRIWAGVRMPLAEMTFFPAFRSSCS
jgi:hypothetical protein